MTEYAATAAPSPRRFLGLSLNGDVFPVVTCSPSTWPATLAIMLATFVTQTQPFLLAEVLLDPSARSGGERQPDFWNEIVIIVTVGLWGSLSDRIRRRLVTAAGFDPIAAGIFHVRLRPGHFQPASLAG